MKKTTTEAELRQWLKQGKTHEQIARLLGRHLSAVAAACAALGLTNERYGRRPSNGVSVERFVEGLRAGETIREIAAKHGMSHATVVNALKRKGLPTCARLLLVQEAANRQQPVGPPSP